MKFRSLLVLLLATAVPVICPGAHAQDNLKTVLAQMDAAHAHFKSATASFRWENFERVVRDTTVQTGTIYFERVGDATEMGASVNLEGAKTKPQLIEYRNGVLKLYKPEDNHVDLMKAGSNQAQYEGFLTLGFGGSGKNLAAVWQIKDQGSETLKDGNKEVKVEKLDLVAIDPAARNTFSHVTIWVDPVRGVSLKQMFFTPSGDTRTSYFFNIQLNGGVDRGPYTIPKGVPVSTH